MQSNRHIRLITIFASIILLFSFISIPSSARDKKGRFVVVIDAGHGGHDSGAVGKIYKEKNIVLDIALKVGENIKAMNPDIVVHYTRKTDKFVGLYNRAQFAIDKHADLFVSIHANANKNRTPNGAETYVLGLHRTKDNLEVAMKENSAIMLEDNYTTKYEDFNPNSSESYIIFEFMQNKYLDSSISLANLVQKGLVQTGRADRGVRQAGFLVLREVSMPSVLVEIGFISNREEEKYIGSEKGKTKLADKIANSIVLYEKSLSARSGQ